MTLGKYTVRIGLRADNPAFAVYLIYVGDRLVGKQFSVPSVTDCDWLSKQIPGCTSYTNGTKCRYGMRHSTGGHRTRNATKPG